MLARIKKFFEFAAKNGMYLPMAYDASSEKPSVTLLSFYVGLVLSTLSIIAYHFLPDKLMGPTLTTMLFLGMAFVFYRMRNLDKVKFDLDDRSIELDASEDKETSNSDKQATESGENQKPEQEEEENEEK